VDVLNCPLTEGLWQKKTAPVVGTVVYPMETRHRRILFAPGGVLQLRSLPYAPNRGIPITSCRCSALLSSGYERALV
jgi:hypothetical protein